MFTLILTVAMTQAAPAAPKTALACAWPQVCTSAPVAQLQIVPAASLQSCAWPRTCDAKS